MPSGASAGVATPVLGTTGEPAGCSLDLHVFLPIYVRTISHAVIIPAAIGMLDRIRVVNLQNNQLDGERVLGGLRGTPSGN